MVAGDVRMRSRLGSLAAACLLADAAQAAPARVAGAPTCRELERKLDLTKAQATSTQLNLMLFSAADAGCLPLARRLLEAGASLEARDRFVAMALARAARSGHVALVELFLARGAAIDSTPRPRTSGRRPLRRSLPTRPIPICRAHRASLPLPRPRSKATAASSMRSSPAAPTPTSLMRPAKRQ